MKRKPYDSTEAVKYYLNHYLTSQQGGYLSYFEGLPIRQTGSGILGTIFRGAIPIIKKGAQALLPHALNLGTRVIKDVVLDKQGLKKSLRKRSLQSIKEAGSNLPKKANKDIFSKDF